MATIVEWYRDLMDNKSDPRVKDWWLMSGPLPTVIICLSYAAFVTKIGPKLMENRKAFELKNTLIVYNLFQVIFSAWIFNESIHAGWFTTYSFRCQPVDYSYSPHALRTAAGCWWYYFSKFTEFFDTFFFVLRKKNNQITRLHVIHHGIMPLSTWFGVKFTPGGHSTFFGMINTFVHIIMYTYYLLAACGPQMQKYLWWKKYLTAFQMVQFVLVMLHAFQLLFIECDYPKAFVWWIGMHAFMFYFLFKDFYNQAYKAKQNKFKKDDDHKGSAILTNGAANGLHRNGVSGYQNGTNGTTKLNGHTNGIKNGIHNGNGLSNGHANGISNGNGLSNGHANGISNGNGLSNGHTNGISNGNGLSNGHTNGISNGNGLSNGNGYVNGNGIHHRHNTQC